MSLTTTKTKTNKISPNSEISLKNNNINPKELMEHYNGEKVSTNLDIILYCNIIKKNNRVNSNGVLTLDAKTIDEFKSRRNVKEITVNVGDLSNGEIIDIVNKFHDEIQKENKKDICATYAVMMAQWLGYELKNSESKEGVGIDACELPYTLPKDGYENVGKKINAEEMDELPDGSMILIRNERSKHLGRFENKVKKYNKNDKNFPTHVIVKIDGKWYESSNGNLVVSTSEQVLQKRTKSSHITHIMKPRKDTIKHEEVTVKRMYTLLKSAGDALAESRNNDGFSGVAAVLNHKEIEKKEGKLAQVPKKEEEEEIKF